MKFNALQSRQLNYNSQGGTGFSGGGGGSTPPVVTGWLLDGNTVGAEKTIGTLDDFDFPIVRNSIEMARFTATGFGVGTASPITKIETSANDASSIMVSTRYSSNTAANGFLSRKARGSSSTPLATNSGDFLGKFGGVGYGATAFGTNVTGYISFSAAEAFTDSAMGTYASIYTTPLTSTTAAERVRVSSEGLVGINQPAGSARLHVKSGSGEDILLLETSAGAVGAEFFNSGRVLFDSGGFDYTPNGAIDLKGNFGHIRLRKGDSTLISNLEISTNDTVFDNNAELIFRTTASAELMRLSALGYLGINTMPVAMLHVKGLSTSTINQRLEPIANLVQDVAGGTVSTSGAVTSTVQTIAIPNNSIKTITARVTYRKTAGAGTGTVGQGSSMNLTASVQNIGNTLTLGTVQNDYTDAVNAIAGVSATITISGTNALVRVTGIVNDDIDWYSVSTTSGNY